MAAILIDAWVVGFAAGDLDPVWKLQDPGCDQGYGSERSPEEEFPPAMPVDEDFEDQEEEVDLRQMYPFINDGNLHKYIQIFIQILCPPN